MSDLIDVPRSGKLSIASNNDGASKNATLLVVFGGIPVDKIEFDGIKRKKHVFVLSGDYMWNFMNDLKDRFHIFVSANSHASDAGADVAIRYQAQSYEEANEAIIAKARIKSLWPWLVTACPQ